MLPFLKNKKDAGMATSVIQKTREPDKTQENQDDSTMPIEACASDIIMAIHARDAKALAQALQDTFEIMKSSPEDEPIDSEPGENV